MAISLYKMNPSIYDSYIGTKIEKLNFEAVLKEIKGLIKGENKIKILDLCCGTGFFPRNYLAKMNNVEYVGVDINKSFIDFAKNNLRKPNFKFIVADAVNVKLNERFDIVLATFSYHHIKDKNKRKFLKNVVKYLKPKGYFIVYEKIVAEFKNHIEAIDSGTNFYLKRIKHMMQREKLNEGQMFALFNEMYLTSIREEEYKVSYKYFLKNLRDTGLKLVKEKKLWPKNNIFSSNKIGDFVFVIKK